jgi:O-antigen/teichoic acid export membrane protein
MAEVAKALVPEELPIAIQPESRQVVKRALARNISRDGAARVGYLLTRLLIPPFVLMKIGLSAYSIWSAIFILVSYVGVTTMGISAVYMKYTAEFTSRGETDEVNSLLSTGLFVTTAVCAVIFLIVFFGLHTILIWTRVPDHLLAEAQMAILIVIGMFLGEMALSVFTLALIGSQRIAEAQGVWVISYLTEMVLIFVLVGTGHGLLGLAEAFLIRGLISIGLNAWVAFRTLPWLRISPWRFSSASLHKLAGFGSVVQLNSLLSIALNTIERVVAAPLIGLSAVGVMDLSDKWPTMSSMVTDAFGLSFLPAASYLHGCKSNRPFGDDGGVPQLYLRGARYMNLASASMCALLATASGPFLAVWLGSGYPASALLMTIFAVQQNIHHMTGPGTSILKGIGRPKEEFYYVLPNIILALIAIPMSRVILGRWSVIGLGSAMVVATIISAIFFVAHANRTLSVPVGKYLRTVVMPGLTPYAVGLVFALPAWKYDHNLTRLRAAVILMSISVGYAITLAMTIDRFVFDNAERSWFRSIIRRESSHVLSTIGIGGAYEPTS